MFFSLSPRTHDCSALLLPLLRPDWLLRVSIPYAFSKYIDPKKTPFDPNSTGNVQHMCPESARKNPSDVWFRFPQRGTLIGLGGHLSHYSSLASPQSGYSWLPRPPPAQSPVMRKQDLTGPPHSARPWEDRRFPGKGVWANKEPLCLVPRLRAVNPVRGFLSTEVLETQF